jgi:hypothetical protein
VKNLIYKYLVYIVYFLGIGMTSSGIVLMPFNYVRYSIIMVIGLGLFLTGSIFNELVINKTRLSASESVKLVVFSLTLAIGIGMISGGISHFKESPRYVSYLIPLGIIISFISFAIKNNIKLSESEKLIIFTSVVVFALFIHIGLVIAAENAVMSMPPGGDIFKPKH